MADQMFIPPKAHITTGTIQSHLSGFQDIVFI
jgi:hypothetical protein